MGPNGPTDGLSLPTLRPLPQTKRESHPMAIPCFRCELFKFEGRVKLKGMQNKPNLIHLPDGCLVFSGVVAKVK